MKAIEPYNESENFISIMCSAASFSPKKRKEKEVSWCKGNGEERQVCFTYEFIISVILSPLRRILPERT